MANKWANTEQLAAQLHDVPYFAGLGDVVIAESARQMVVRSYAQGEQIFLKGEGVGEAPFRLVLDGTVRIYVISPRGREQVLRLFNAGDTFADVPLFDGGGYPASADALTPVTLGLLPRNHLLRLMGDHPELALNIVGVMAGRLRHFNTLIEDLSLRRVRSRVAHMLAAEQASALTQAQMAAMIGSSREMVNRSLHSLEDEAVIELHDDGTLKILDAGRLAEIVDDY